MFIQTCPSETSGVLGLKRSHVWLCMPRRICWTTIICDTWLMFIATAIISVEDYDLRVTQPLAQVYAPSCGYGRLAKKLPDNGHQPMQDERACAGAGGLALTSCLFVPFLFVWMDETEWRTRCIVASRQTTTLYYILRNIAFMQRLHRFGFALSSALTS